MQRLVAMSELLRPIFESFDSSQTAHICEHESEAGAHEALFKSTF